MFAFQSNHHYKMVILNVKEDVYSHGFYDKKVWAKQVDHNGNIQFSIVRLLKQFFFSGTFFQAVSEYFSFFFVLFLVLCLQVGL